MLSRPPESHGLDLRRERTWPRAGRRTLVVFFGRRLSLPVAPGAVLFVLGAIAVALVAHRIGVPPIEDLASTNEGSLGMGFGIWLSLGAEWARLRERHGSPPHPRGT